MKFIKPSEISSKIMTLFEESDKFVFIVSPYVKISGWYKLLKKFENLASRRIPLDFIIRDDKTNQRSFDELNRLGFRYTAIPDLHAKLYLNEKYAIISSMNLLLSSEINSLETAYATETEKEYNEIIDFCKRYLNISFNKRIENQRTKNQTPENEGTNWLDYVIETLNKNLRDRIKVKTKSSHLDIQTSKNNYSAFIWNNNRNHRLRISGILSQKEYDFLKNNKNRFPEVDNCTIELIKGKGREYNTIWGTVNTPLKSYELPSLITYDEGAVVNGIIEFISEIDGFKKWTTENL